MGNSSSGSVKWHVYTELSQCRTLAKRWKTLEIRSPQSVFSSFDWLNAWIDIYWQPNYQLQLMTAEIDGHLVAIVPLYIQSSNSLLSKKTLMPIGQGEPEESEVLSEFQDIIVGKLYDGFYSDLVDQISKLNFDAINCKNILASSHWAKTFALMKSSKASSAGKRYLIENKENYLCTLSKNNQSKWKRSKKKLDNKGAQFHWVNNEEIPHYWEALKVFHQTRWQNKGQKGAFYHKDFTKFHELYFELSGNIKIAAITVNEIPIAINYYLCDQDTLYFYQSGWDQNGYAKESPGFALHIWAILTNPFKIYDFMIGEEDNSYKQAFVPNSHCGALNFFVPKNKIKLASCRIVSSLANKLRQPLD